jgi:flavin reductase (DIM6/NTAB) family NADH-FMN oxidoreductase RutF
MKKSVPIKPFWYSDILVLPKVVTVITTVNEAGVINAAPYSLFIPYNVMNRSPQVLVGMRKFSHTYKNIIATGEFVVNFPKADFLDDVMETSRFYPEGVNELKNTRFTPVTSAKIAPPSIKECPQHIECKLHKNYEVDRTQAQVIGDILSIEIDESLISADRGERIRQLNLPLYMGDEKRKYFYYCKANAPEMIELQSPPESGKDGNGEIETKLEWDDKALQAINEIPSSARTMVVEMVEDLVQKEGFKRVNYENFLNLMKQYAPTDVMKRFETD